MIDETCLGVRTLESAVGHVLVPHLYNLGVVSGEDDDGDIPEEELHVCGLLHEYLMHAVAQTELTNLCIIGVLACCPVNESDSLSIAALHVECLRSLRNHIHAKEALQLIRHVVVIAIVDILIISPIDGDRRIDSITHLA